MRHSGWRQGRDTGIVRVCAGAKAIVAGAVRRGRSGEECVNVDESALPMRLNRFLVPLARRAPRVGLLMALAACSSVPLRPLPRPVPVASPPPPPTAQAPVRPAPLPAVVTPAPAASAPVAQAQPVSIRRAARAGAAGACASRPAAALRARRRGAFRRSAGRFPHACIRPRPPGLHQQRRTARGMVDLVRASGQRLGGTEIQLLQLGTSQNGTPLEALLFSRGNPAAVLPLPGAVLAGAMPGRPTVLLVGAAAWRRAGRAAKRCSSLPRNWPAAASRALLDRINVVVDAARQSGRRRGEPRGDRQRHRRQSRPPAAARRRRRRRLARLVREFAPLVVVDAARVHRRRRAISRSSARCSASTRCCSTRSTANMPPFVTRAAEEWFRAPARRPAEAAAGLTARVVLHDLHRHRRQEDLDGRHAAGHRAQRLRA